VAASERFESYLSALSPQALETAKDLIGRHREDLFAARSEEARVRIVEELVEELHDRIRTAKR